MSSILIRDPKPSDVRAQLLEWIQPYQPQAAHILLRASQRLRAHGVSPVMLARYGADAERSNVVLHYHMKPNPNIPHVLFMHTESIRKTVLMTGYRKIPNNYESISKDYDTWPALVQDAYARLVHPDMVPLDGL